MTEQEIDDPALEAAVHGLAAALGEHEAEPLATLRRLLAIKGVGFAQRILQKTQAREDAGGMLTHDKTRRRTVGGVFFLLARRSVSPVEHQQIWPGHNLPPAHKRAIKGPRIGASPTFDWRDRQVLYQSLEEGKVRTVKMTIVGRPGPISHQGTYVLTTMRDGSAPSLPRGLPPLPSAPQRYAVCIARRHWDQISTTLANPDDQLIVEGHAIYDDKLPGILLYATNVTTKLLQIARRAQQGVKT